ncbi:MAG: Biotin transport system permease protein [Candidatus Tokpelaia sp. JSC188]|nr:MAG: Biotin transport system permease protein [Candidatus Tokpelaia sp. JSC188]
MKVFVDSTPATSYFHELRPGIKLALLFIFSFLVFFIDRLDITIAAFGIILLLYRIAGFSFTQSWKQIRSIWLLLVILFIFHSFASSWQSALLVVLRFACLLLFAGLITLTTSMSQMMESLEHIFQFLKPFGANPSKISLALSLTLRFIPVLRQIAQEVRETRKVRGLEGSIVAMIIPITIRALKMSENTTMAIEARAYDSDMQKTPHKKERMIVGDIVSIAFLAAFISTLGFLPLISIPGFAVPITAQTLGIMLAGAILGAKKGLYAVIVILLLVAAGLPLLSGGHGGISIFFGPSAGYCIGWALGAWLIGFLYQTFHHSLTSFKEIVFLVLGGVIAIHCPGILWLAYNTDISIREAFFASLIFIPGDLVKVAITYFIIRIIRKVFSNVLY